MPSQFFKPVSFASRINALGPKKILFGADILGFVASGSFNFFLSQNPQFLRGNKVDAPPFARRRRSF